MDKKNPLIIPRPDHIVSRSSLSPNAMKVLHRLKREGFTAYLVGGCVRDLLLGREPKDFDVVTDATPGQVKRLFRNCRLVGRRFRLAHLHFSDEIIEVATFRAEQPDDGEEGNDPSADNGTSHPESERKGRHPRHLKSEEGTVLRDNVFGTPEQDAMRRDFSVNALFYDICTFSIIDYTGGMDDLQRAVIRTIGPPEVRFTEDPVRMLRAVRFAALLAFSFDEATWNAIVNNSAFIARSAPARLYEEILKLFHCGEGEKCYQLLRRSGLMQALFPEFSRWLERESAGFPHARIGLALDWIDRKVAEGERVSPQLLLALVFGEYLEEMREGFCKDGTPTQQGIDMAMARLLGDTAPIVLIPGKVALQIREILQLQSRFRKTPGKRPQSVISRHCFADALAYFSFTCNTRGEGTEKLRWWERFAGENDIAGSEMPVASEDAGAAASRVKRPRRRRRHKKVGIAQSP